MSKKNDSLLVRISDEEKAELGELVERLPNPDLTVSDFVRDAVREKARKERRKLERAEAAAATTA